MKFDIINDNFNVEFSLGEKLLCLKRRLLMPLDKIVSARIMGDEAMEGISWRLIGTGPLPGYKPGLFLQDDERVFFNAHEGMPHLVIELKDFYCVRVVLDATEANQEIIDRLLTLKG